MITEQRLRESIVYGAIDRRHAEVTVYPQQYRIQYSEKSRREIRAVLYGDIVNRCLGDVALKLV